MEASDEVFWHKNGTAIPVVYRATLVKGATGKPTGVVTTFYDISKQVAAEQEQEILRRQMEHTQRLESLGVLAGGIAHDFNNLLSVIMGNVEIARTHVCMPCAVENPLNRIEKAGQRAADLCQQMLAYAGEGRFSVQKLNLSERVREMGDLLHVSLNQGVQMSYDLVDGLPLIEADKAQVQQVVMNLITNANDAMEDGAGGMITVRTGVQYVTKADMRDAYGEVEAQEIGDFVFVDVRDQGCGMSQEVQEKIFDPFFTTKFTGRGLGMSAILGIVRSHKGLLFLQSHEGEGTWIRICFPALPELSKSVQAPAFDKKPIIDIPKPVAASNMPEGMERKHQHLILVIDDEEGLREMTAFMLQDAGYDVMTAKDGAQGVALFKQHHAEIALVLQDMSMPKMSGRACVQALRAIRADVPVLLMSGYHESEFGDLGAFLGKPFSAKDLRKKVASLLASH